MPVAWKICIFAGIFATLSAILASINRAAKRKPKEEEEEKKKEKEKHCNQFNEKWIGKDSEKIPNVMYSWTQIMFYAKTKYIDYIEGIAINSIVIFLYSRYIFCLDTKRVLQHDFFLCIPAIVL